MLGQRRRRWTNITPPAVQYLVFPRIYINHHSACGRYPFSDPHPPLYYVEMGCQWIDWMDGLMDRWMDGFINV